MADQNGYNPLMEVPRTPISMVEEPEDAILRLIDECT